MSLNNPARFTIATSGSWLNAVAGYFVKLTKRHLRRGVFSSVTQLQAGIDRFVADTSDDPKRFV